MSRELRRVLGGGAGDRTEPVALFNRFGGVLARGGDRGGAGLRQEGKRSPSAGLSLRPGLTSVEMLQDRERWGHRCWSPCPGGGILGGGGRRE